jgi:hypothetical protein
MRRDDERMVEEIRRLFERYRVTARNATEAARPRRAGRDQQAESPERAPALRLR